MALGLDPEKLVSPAAASGRAPSFELWPEHLPAFEVFSLCHRQWRTVLGPRGIWYQALDLLAVECAMRLIGVPAEGKREIAFQLRVMEDEGLRVLNAGN